ncbi:hypothetical protein TWF694_004183 [Orbilia ellipsospora]|uniref:NACHT domain-containing protein n=1 Tax=Orbilia ellipsospora TaxID=2528407 RepID=A0AAV9WYG0_9PEZI
MGYQLDSDDYTIGWVCALPVELAAAISLLDERHLPLPQSEKDDNTYSFGRIGSCNVIIACLPKGEYGVTSAAKVITKMVGSFPSIEYGLMVGIAGGAPVLPKQDIRLGDVVVGVPERGYTGVVQYDFGKTVQEGQFVQTGILNKPATQFLTIVSAFEEESLRKGQNTNNEVSSIISKALKDEAVAQEFARPPNDGDRLFRADYDHPSGDVSCDRCETTNLEERNLRSDDEPHIHYGLIASGNQVMKHGMTRDTLARKHGVLCFEMEAAGLVDSLPTLVVRGICDYSDSHKSKQWQPYAALSAAAFAKALLLRLQPAVRNKESNQAQRFVLNIPIAAGAVFGSYADQHEPECLNGTRVDLIHQIMTWIDDPKGEKMLWLVGMAGTGKSTISRTVARKLDKNNNLAASFFFQRSQADRSSSKRFISTIASQLAGNYRSLRSSIQKGIQAYPDITTRALNEQFEKLILEPLSNINIGSSSARFVLLIDALDECEGKDDIKLIIHLLARLKDLETVDVRVFLTSRPDLPIYPTFHALPETTYKSIKLQEAPNVEQDISLLLRYELSKIREYHKLPEIRKTNQPSQKWPGEERTQLLIRMSIPLFIYAATLCRFINDEEYDPEERINKILGYQNDYKLSQLQRTYFPVLDGLISDPDPDKARTKLIIDRSRLVIGTIVTLVSPLSAVSLANMLSLSEGTVNSRLRRLHSVLVVPEDIHAPIRTFHLSFRDFLLDPSLRDESSFWVDEEESHKIIAERCIELMSGNLGLKRDLCELRYPGKMTSEIDARTIEKYLSPELQYACRYWVYHLRQSGQSLVDNDQVHTFLEEHLLHWLEATSLLNITSELMVAIDNLIYIIDTDNGQVISALVDDIKRFVLRNQRVIGLAPLQTYCSALFFLPKRSIVRCTFESQEISRPQKMPQIQDDWDDLLQTFSGHQRSVTSVAFSPDGKTLASASHDRTIRIWDVVTGINLTTLRGHKSVITCVAFSHDGKVLASGSKDKTIKIWDIALGIVRNTLTGHIGDVTSITFSSDAEKLVSGSDDKTARIWNFSTGVQLHILDGHEDEVFNIAFSSTGSKIFSASGDYMVRVWDAVTGEALDTYEYPVDHSLNACSIAISPGGKILALASWDRSTSVWDLEKRTILYTLYTCFASAVAFSPDGNILVSSDNNTIRTWDAVTGEAMAVLSGPTTSILTLVFSPDGKMLASGSEDKTVRVWNAMINPKHAQSPERYAWAWGQDSLDLPYANEKRMISQSVRSVAFSPDGTVLASADDSDKVTVWNTATGAVLGVLKAPKSNLSQVIFSPDGKLLASGDLHSVYEPVRIWDMTKGAVINILENHRSRVSCIVFSPDSKMVAAGFTSGRLEKIGLWSATGARVALHILEGHGSKVRGIVFSPDIKLLASASFDSTIRLWDITDGVILQRLANIPTFMAGNLQFSSDGKLVVYHGQFVKIEIANEGGEWNLLMSQLGCDTKWILFDSAEEEGDRIAVNDEWLTKDGEKLIWLPPEYRPKCSTGYKGTIALGYESGKVSFFTLEDSTYEGHISSVSESSTALTFMSEFIPEPASDGEILSESEPNHVDTDFTPAEEILVGPELDREVTPGPPDDRVIWAVPEPAFDARILSDPILNHIALAELKFESENILDSRLNRKTTPEFESDTESKSDWKTMVITAPIFGGELAFGSTSSLETIPDSDSDVKGTNYLQSFREFFTKWGVSLKSSRNRWREDSEALIF